MPLCHNANHSCKDVKCRTGKSTTLYRWPRRPGVHQNHHHRRLLRPQVFPHIAYCPGWTGVDPRIHQLYDKCRGPTEALLQPAEPETDYCPRLRLQQKGHCHYFLKPRYHLHSYSRHSVEPNNRQTGPHQTHFDLQLRAAEKSAVTPTAFWGAWVRQISAPPSLKNSKSKKRRKCTKY